MMESAVKTPLISEQSTRKHGVSSKVVGAILTIIGVGIVMLITPSSKMEAIQELSVGETSVGEFAVGLAEMKIGAPVGTQELGSSGKSISLSQWEKFKAKKPFLFPSFSPNLNVYLCMLRCRNCFK